MSCVHVIIIELTQPTCDVAELSNLEETVIDRLFTQLNKYATILELDINWVNIGLTTICQGAVGAELCR